MERALRVCTTCKTRKKSCDKALPRCGYCTQRGLLCLYENVSGSTPPTGKSPWVIGAATIFSLSSNTFLHSSPSDPPLALDCALHLQVLHVYHLTEQSFSTVSDQYFQNFHLWLPVISPKLLNEINSTLQDSYPPVDFSLLVLAMYLVTLQPADDNAHQIVSPQDLYLELKMLMARVQATVHASTRLIQTGLLLASFEYACGKPHVAYVSIGTCAGMASILGIHYGKSKKEAFTNKPDLDLKMLEGRNICWGMMVLERYVYSTLSSILG
ncbi:hypothetical protein N7474_004058 [Penicillium riverlandense]|uniref:uncharacterized protein n=1 Tax=Penicillium riverlandense TaxID=1903569 RepID=UPI002547D2BE|nr:uncharacterized protein N7474_004058 [Penicillium riverlandense]KAJ5818467.1 hypothetical protein N7474_004058 [Penicillium riverlandense]